jgi:hypothetical protein
LGASSSAVLSSGDVGGHIAEAVHGCVVKAELDADLFLASAMIDMYNIVRKKECGKKKRTNI